MMLVIQQASGLVVIARGPLLAGLNPATALYYAATGQTQQLAAYVNAEMVTAETNLPEQSEVQLDLRGWQTALGSGAQFVASQIQAQYEAGNVVYPGLNGAPDEIPQTWGGFAFAVGDDATDTVTLRWVKAQPFLPWVVVGIVLAVAVVAVVYLLEHGTATMSSNNPSAGSVVATTASFLVRNLWWEVPTVAAVAVAPYIVRKLAAIREAENEYRAAQGGRY